MIRSKWRTSWTASKRSASKSLYVMIRHRPFSNSFEISCSSGESMQHRLWGWTRLIRMKTLWEISLFQRACGCVYSVLAYAILDQSNQYRNNLTEVEAPIDVEFSCVWRTGCISILLCWINRHRCRPRHFLLLKDVSHLHLLLCDVSAEISLQIDVLEVDGVYYGA